MKTERKRSRNKSSIDIKKYSRLMIILAVVIVLILVIVIVGKIGNGNSSGDVTEASESAAVQVSAQSGETVTETETETESTVEPDNNVYTTDFSAYELQKDAVPEINTLIENYYQARSTADVETMYKLFGRTDTDGMEELRTSLQKLFMSFEKYENIVCYTKPGLEDGSYIVFVSSDMKFVGVDTLGASLIWVYVTKDAEGNYVLSEPDKITPEQREYIDQVERSEDVRLLANQVTERLKSAIESDPKLASFYQKITPTQEAETGKSGTGEGETGEGETEESSTDTAVEIGGENESQ